MSANQLWPSLLPAVSDPLWFNVDRPKDDEAELAALEEKHQAWMNAIANKDATLVPIGKISSEPLEEEEEEEDEEECEEEEESDTNDDPDTDMMDEGGSNDETSTYG